MLRILITAVLTIALLAGGTLSALASNGDGNESESIPMMDISELESLVAEMEGIEEFELEPAPLPGRTVSIDGGFRGVWGSDNTPDVKATGVVAGIYGRVDEPDGTGYGFFGGVWSDRNGGLGGYLQGRYADGYFWGTWRCLETGEGGLVGGTYSPDPGAASELVNRFRGIWVTSDGQHTGYLKGTWAPVAQSQPGGKFAGLWKYNPDVSATDVAADGKLRGAYRVLQLVDGTTMHYFKGRWNAYEGARGRLAGLALDGRFYGLWKTNDGSAQGYLKGVWADNRFKGRWGHVGHDPEGVLWGRYGPVVTPQPQEAQPLPMKEVNNTRMQPVETKPLAIQS
ncbi:MAG: hypothetical protein JSW38_03705 [Dehalococcoidia bacterium]|nr:MAG: hypothetical protein JSV02_05920 [Dehalococcoidia bacterium]UCG83934.1 MAG: hypothetical protein JSW38_03705 [Dehalococcoidia bacterium]